MYRRATSPRGDIVEGDLFLMGPKHPFFEGAGGVKKGNLAHIDREINPCGLPMNTTTTELGPPIDCKRDQGSEDVIHSDYPRGITHMPGEVLFPFMYNILVSLGGCAISEKVTLMFIWRKIAADVKGLSLRTLGSPAYADESPQGYVHPGVSAGE